MKQKFGALSSLAGVALLAGCATTKNVELDDAPDAANARYSDILDEEVELVDGRFMSDTAPGSVRRDAVMLDAQMDADVDGDGASETVALIAHEAGGSGRFVYLAVVNDMARATPTRLIGDRVQLMSWAAGGGLIEAVVLQSGDADAACCPSHIVRAQWPWRATDGIGRLSAENQRRLSVADLDGTWRLTALYGESIQGEISLKLDGGAVSGNAGCNGYFGRVVSASAPGALTFGPLGMTRMACGADIDRLEQRYAAALGAVTGYGFLPGQLLLEGPAGALVFERSYASIK